MPKARKLPSGNWRVQANKTINGKIIRKSFTSENKKQAEYMASEWLIDFTTENTLENITLRQAYTKYIEMKDAILSPSTIRGYNALQRNTFLDIMDFPISRITPQMIQIEVNKLASRSTPKYVRNAYGLLNAVFKVFRTDLALNISLPQKNKPELYIPDDNDIKTLLNHIEGKNLEIPILLAAFGPMRRSEICALTSDDVSGNIITVNKALVKGDDGWHTKTPKTYSSYRQIEYPDFVIEKIKDIEGPIVKMTPTAITKFFAIELKKCGLPSFRFHDLRHYAVSTLHSINVPDKYIMARGGWSTNHTMNNIYNHILKNKSDEYNLKIQEHYSNLYNKKSRP